MDLSLGVCFFCSYKPWSVFVPAPSARPNVGLCGNPHVARVIIIFIVLTAQNQFMDFQALYLIVLGVMHVTDFRIPTNEVTMTVEFDDIEMF